VIGRQPGSRLRKASSVGPVQVIALPTYGTKWNFMQYRTRQEREPDRGPGAPRMCAEALKCHETVDHPARIGQVFVAERAERSRAPGRDPSCFGVSSLKEVGLSSLKEVGLSSGFSRFFLGWQT
jgi:hypothetical protein